MSEATLLMRLQGDDKLSGVIGEAQKKTKEFVSESEKIEKATKRFRDLKENGASTTSQLGACKAAMQKVAQIAGTNSEAFKKLADDYKKLGLEAKKTSDAIKDLDKDIEKAANKAKKINMKDMLTGLGDKVAGSLGLGSMSSALSAIASPAGAAVAAVGAVGATFVAAGKKAAEFEQHTDALQALTGLDDAGMQSIKDGAIEMSKKFGQSANDVVDAMGMIGSQAPELLKDSDALMSVTDAANTLAKAGGVSVEQAAKTITTTMNQFGVSGEEATNIINNMAAGSQQGAAGLDYISKAFEKAGTAAKGAGMDYSSLTAMIETVAPKFSSADQAGTALQGTLLALSVSGKKEFMPSVVGMQQALENLADAQLDDLALKQLVGASNMNMIKSMIEGRDQFAEYDKSLRGTSTAVEQAATNMDNFTSRVDIFKANWDAFLIKLGQSALINGIMGGIEVLMDLIMSLFDEIGAIIDSFSLFNTDGVDSVNMFEVEIEALKWVLHVLGQLVQIVVALIAKWFNHVRDVVTGVVDGIKNAWNSLMDKLKDVPFVQSIINAFNKVAQAVVNIVNKIKKLWSKFLQWLGLETKEAAEEKIEKEVVEATTVTEETKTETKNTGSGTDKTGGKSKTTKKEEKVKDVNSVSYAQDKLKEVQDLKLRLSVDDEAGIRKANEDIQKWISEIEKRTIKLLFVDKIDLDKASLDDIQNRIKELDKLKFSNFITPEQFTEVKRQLNELTAKKNEIERNRIIKDKLIIDSANLSDVENRIKELEKIRFDEMLTPEQFREVNDELERLIERKRKIERDRVNLEANLKFNVDGKSEKEIKDRISVLETALRLTIDEEEKSRIKAEINNLLDSLEANVTIKSLRTDNNYAKGSDGDKRQSLSNAESKAGDIQQKFKIGLIGHDEAQRQLDAINQQLESLGLKDIDFKIDNLGDLTTAKDRLDDLMSTMSSMSGTMGQYQSQFMELVKVIGNDQANAADIAAASLATVGQAMSDVAGEGAVAKVGAVMAAIGQIVLGFATASAQAATMGPFGWLAFTAAGLAAVATTISTITSFANGGIVPGSSIMGDKITAVNVNSGEMILNKRQQYNLFNMLDSNGVGVGSLAGNVEFMISGSNLKGTLNNFDSKMKKLK